MKNGICKLGLGPQQMRIAMMGQSPVDGKCVEHVCELPSAAGAHSMSRRALVKAAGLAAALAPASAALGILSLTPRQSEGPFYPLALPLDFDADLVQVAGMSRPATGIAVHLTGQVVAASGNPIPGAAVEIWQCDAFGAYKHPRDRGDVSEPEFQGFGMTTTSKQGEFRFRTIRPVSYPGRAPHIHVKIKAAGMRTLTTQLYVAGEPRNAADFLYSRIPEARRALVTAHYPDSPEQSPAIIPRYTIVVG